MIKSPRREEKELYPGDDWADLKEEGAIVREQNRGSGVSYGKT